MRDVDVTNSQFLMSLFSQLIDVEGDGERQSTTEAIARLPVTNFSVLELYISANAHVIGSLVSCLLQILPATQKLKLVMVCQSEVTYPLNLSMCYSLVFSTVHWLPVYMLNQVQWMWMDLLSC